MKLLVKLKKKKEKNKIKINQNKKKNNNNKYNNSNKYNNKIHKVFQVMYLMYNKIILKNHHYHKNQIL